VIGVHDLEVASQELRALQCRFPDSLLVLWLGEGFVPRMAEVAADLRDSSAPLGKDSARTIFLSSARQLWKVLLFVEGQEVSVAPELTKAVKALRGCPSVTVAKGQLRESFQRWLRFEVYLRSRYASGGMSEKQEWKTRRAQAIAQLAESIDKQYFHENFW